VQLLVGSLLPRFSLWNVVVEAAVAFSVVWLILFWMYRTKTFVRV
jgi:hypothetical protein